MKTILRLLPTLSLMLLLAVPAARAAIDYERTAREKVAGFVQGTLKPADFAVTSPWRKVFGPANLANRLPLTVQSIEVPEVRLPSNPGGMEALFTVKVKLAQPAWLGATQIPAGDYTLAGTMTFYETTRGVIVRDCDFLVLNKSGDTVGGNYLPWKVTKP
jgi:hypothetical protein